MSRHPLRALAEADAIAKKRGHVQHYERGAGMICDFTITIPSATPRSDQADAIPPLHCAVAGTGGGRRDRRPPVVPVFSGDLPRVWICSPEYAYRFFRVCDTTLIELGRDGQPLPAKSPAPRPKAEGPVARPVVPADSGNREYCPRST